MKPTFHSFYLLLFTLSVILSACSDQVSQEEMLTTAPLVSLGTPLDTVDLDFYEVNNLDDVRTYFLSEGFSNEHVDKMLKDERFLESIESDMLGKPTTERCYACNENYISMTSLENSGAWGYVYMGYRQGNSIPVITFSYGDSIVAFGLVHPRFIQRCTYKRGFANMRDSGFSPRDCPGPGGNQYILNFRNPNGPGNCASGEVTIGKNRRANCP
ncbi:MAG: hypothetical protein AAFR59_08605 [Bacteroidota bacterium]